MRSGFARAVHFIGCSGRTACGEWGEERSGSSTMIPSANSEPHPTTDQQRHSHRCCAPSRQLWESHLNSNCHFAWEESSDDS